MVPSSSMAFSEFTMLYLIVLQTARRPSKMGAGCAITPDLPAIARKRTVTATAPTTATWPWALFARTGFVDRQVASIEVLTIKGAHGRIGLGVITHGDEREAAGFARHPIHHQMDFVDSAVLFEKILKIVLGALKGEITYVQFHCV
jgi:hypothetical protein